MFRRAYGNRWFCQWVLTRFPRGVLRQRGPQGGGVPASECGLWSDWRQAWQAGRGWFYRHLAGLVERRGRGCAEHPSDRVKWDQLAGLSWWLLVCAKGRWVKTHPTLAAAVGWVLTHLCYEIERRKRGPPSAQRANPQARASWVTMLSGALPMNK